MARILPVDFGTAGKSRKAVSPVERNQASLGQFTANTTVTPAPRIIFDRDAVIREIWIAASAIPADADGTMLFNALLNDVSESADDTLVASQDLETLIVAANKGYACTLLTEGTENELTVSAGDVLRFTLVNNSAAINTNADFTALVIWQALSAAA